MPRMIYDKDSVTETAMQIVKDQHEFFAHGELDNSDHIPLVIRIAESAGVLLASGGMPKREAEAIVDRIIQFGRQLFIQLWMTPVAVWMAPPREEDAIKEFDRYLEPARRTRFRKAAEASSGSEGLQ